MDIIEQAAKRLAELKRAGVDVPPSETPAPEVVVQPEEPIVTPLAAQVKERSDSVQAASSSNAFSRRVELDMDLIARKGIVTPQAERSQLADELRVIKRPLLRNATGKGGIPVKDGNLIMVTSAVPGEGKSFTAANLAMSIAMELDHTVLLVDADVARPTLPTIFDLPPTKGLLDVLLDSSVDLSQVLLRTNVDKLSILPSGTQHPRATELLASDAMNRLLANMAARYSDRIIIFDSPPLLVTTEARVLASHMGQVVVVVRAERTTHSEIKHALSFIESCPVKMLMLNQAASGVVNGYGYGYGYDYYGYGQDTSDRQRESEWRGQ